jgi:tripeptide aminopeptidase
VNDALLDDLLGLAAVPAPTFAERERIEWLESRLDGAPGERHVDAAGNLVWQWGADAPRLLLLAHVDTVFPADTPLTFTIEGGRLTGPGIGDNAAAVTVVLHVVSELLAAGALAPGAVAFTVAEEGLGNLRGALAACRTIRPGAVIAVEGHGLERVLVDAIGSIRARVCVVGPGGHSWQDRGSPSAVHTLLELGHALLEFGADQTPVNVGLISGGVSVNTIAPEAELVVEMRAQDEEPLDRFTDALSGLTVAPPLAVEVEVVGRRPGGRLDRDSPLLNTVRDVRRRLGLPDELSEGSTDANAALAQGIPALTLGVAHGAGMHTPDEWIEEASLEAGRAQLEAVLREFLALP